MDAKTMIQLARDGKLDEAQAVLETLMEKAKFAPDEIDLKGDGCVLFYRKGHLVEQGEDGIWKPARERKKL
jgi:hypothetical protein